ncbi:FAD-binding oxidoreductase [Pleionea sp. CnH1-48]|uniref:FAD-binding oxidoreductase n=1 Tax=Pleionea sp. CnH1-48 TaxID=2954494 RepID=UPI0020974FB1|nr:FAD-binding oxidoreductase [Pleionea sp. CnH1-48]MCO7224818.1 FAD-binding oxidoreductase [Pleionea sp. CnH1-48]
MRRWNGWGFDNSEFNYQLSDSARQFLAQQLGEGRLLDDASLEQVKQLVPESRIDEHPMIFRDAETRIRHARGQSLPDWLAVRSGEITTFPDGVALPSNSDEVAQLLAYAQDKNIKVIPYGGGTSVVGHINPEQSEQPVLTISLAKMNRLMAFDEESQIARFGAGTPGPLLEHQLADKGYTLGHFPQSWELSTVGGWVASRSSGQQSLRYGRIEQLFAGGRIETPQGEMDIPTIPASSAGPDVREMILGSEGRMGILTEVDVRVSRLPEHESFHVIFFPQWETAIKACRTLVQNRVQLSMMRLSNPVETMTQLKLAGHESLVGLLEKYLALRGAKDEKCMMVFGVTGSKRQTKSALKQVKSLSRQFGGVYTGTALGKKWAHSRFRSPYLRHGLWEAGYAVDTMETAVDWSRIPQAVESIEQAIRESLSEQQELVHVFTHLSHFYGQGASIYTTYVFRCADSYGQTYQNWQKLKAAGAEQIVKSGGTISHQHGVGVDHKPYLEAEKGQQGMQVIRSLCEHFDPEQMMNPGKLVD